MKYFKELLTEDLVDRAMDVARSKHSHQNRKFGNVAYIRHPMHVAEILKTYSADQYIIAAALLHDTIEDTDTSYTELEATFGKKVANLVKELTSEKNITNKVDYLTKKMIHMSSDALLIKLADRLSNVSDLQNDKKFAVRYSAQTRDILDAVRSKRKIDRPAMRIINQIRKKIEPFIE